MSRPGVSLLVCTHNGARRLRPTLAHLAAQRVAPTLPWEVVLVDNASTDDSAAVARASWPEPAPAPLRVVTEPRLGIGHARLRAVETATYDVVGFVDDDNWLAPDWVQIAWETMQAHPTVGACGSFGEAALEDGERPAWFDANAAAYAVGAQVRAGEATPGALWTAGLVVRRSAWQDVRAAGFEPVLVGRRGRLLSAGEDSELCFALTQAGWRLAYEPRLRYRHAIPPARLTWAYIRTLHYGFGIASVAMDHYYMAAESRSSVRHRLLELWSWRVLASAVRLMGHALRSILGPERSREALRAYIQRGRLRALMGECGEYRDRTRRAREVVRRLAGRRR